jgi:hypothetical protein
MKKSMSFLFVVLFIVFSHFNINASINSIDNAEKVLVERIHRGDVVYFVEVFDFISNNRSKFSETYELGTLENIICTRIIFESKNLKFIMFLNMNTNNIFFKFLLKQYDESIYVENYKMQMILVDFFENGYYDMSLNEIIKINKNENYSYKKFIRHVKN